MTEERSSKRRIYDALVPLKCKVSYNDTVEVQFPRVNFFLLSHNSSRLSNKRHKHYTAYQVDYFSEVPLDVEVDLTLIEITQRLEDAGFLTTDWNELTEIDVEAQAGIYHYWIEVR